MVTATNSNTTPAAPALATQLPRHRLLEVIASEVMMRLDLIGLQLGADMARRQNVDALGELERERRLLLDQQDAEALPVKLAQCLENFRSDPRRQAERRLIEDQQRR